MNQALTKLSELMAQATPGTWRHSLTVHKLMDVYDYTIADFAYSGSDRLCSANAQLVAAMHAALPALIAVAKAAQNLQDYRRSLTGEENDVHVDCRTGALEDAIEDALLQLSPKAQP